MTVGRTTAPTSSAAFRGLKRCVSVDAPRRCRAWSRCARVVRGKAARRGGAGEEEEFFRRGADAKEEEEMTTMGLAFESDETTTMMTATTGFMSWTPSAMDEEYETIASRLETRVDEAFGALEERAKRLRERRKRTASTVGSDERLVVDAIIDARVRSGAETETTASLRMDSAGDAGRGDYGETTTTTAAALEEAKFELEKKMDEVREEMRAVREMKRALESEQGATRGRIEDLQLKYLDGEATRRVLANRLRELGEDPDALAPLGGSLIDDDDENLRAERASHEVTRKALEEMRMTHEASLSLAEALREEVEALRDSTSDSIGAVGPVIPLRDIQLESPLKTLDKTTATAVEAHLLWRRRCEREEPGSAETDWTRAEDLLKDRIARKDGRQLIYWTFLRSVSELLHRGDVTALDDKALAILGDFVARVVVAAEIARADTDA